MTKHDINVGQEVCLDEDMHVEFKMHSKNSIQEIPSRCQMYNGVRISRTMQPNSKVICGFLNTSGGRIFIGVDDEGIIKGLPFSEHMKDHFLISLHSCLRNFKPAVSSELIKVRFVKLNAKHEDCKLGEYGDGASDDSLLNKNKQDIQKFLGHTFNTQRCECEDSSAQLHLVVVQVLPSADGTVYQNDEGLVYVRRNGSCRMVTLDELHKKSLVTLSDPPRKQRSTVQTIWDVIGWLFGREFNRMTVFTLSDMRVH